MKYIITLIACLLGFGWIFRNDIAWLIEQVTRENIPHPLTREEVFELRKEMVEEVFTSSTPLSEPTKQHVQEEDVEQDMVIENKTPSVAPSLAAFNLKIPFTPQAPHANWDMPYQEACEEASVLMASWFIKDVQERTSDEVDQEILELVAWEKERFGYYEDTTMEETLTIAREYFGFIDAYIIEHPTIEDIENAIANGYPMLVPAAGKLLDNPYFSGDGPLYHMLVIRGFTDTHFITNDPGTRRGEAFPYEKKHLMSVMHDWNGGDVENGISAVIVVKY